MTKGATSHEKNSWRRWAKGTRAQLDMPVVSQAIVRQLELWPFYQRAEHILTYIAFGDEVNLAAPYDAPLYGGDLDDKSLDKRRPSKQVYVTRTHKNGTLSVHRLTATLERHPYGFLQPVANSPRVEVARLELLLIPGLAFDTSGNRLGYGQGFYDRLLARTSGVPLVGIAPAELIVSVLPDEPHDVKMTHLLSEEGVLEIAR